VSRDRDVIIDVHDLWLILFNLTLYTKTSPTCNKTNLSYQDSRFISTKF